MPTRYTALSPAKGHFARVRIERTADVNPRIRGGEPGQRVEVGLMLPHRLQALGPGRRGVGSLHPILCPCCALCAPANIRPFSLRTACHMEPAFTRDCWK